MRHDLRTTIEDRLLAANSPVYDLIPRRFVQDCVDRAMAAEQSAAMPIGQLLSLESFLRQFKPRLA
jgi:hypothetical protein